MEVGPSAAPMMAMEAASFTRKEHRRECSSVKKMPNCAAAPKIMQLRVREQRAEVDHRADTDEQYQREQLVRNSRVEQSDERAGFTLLNAVDKSA